MKKVIFIIGTGHCGSTLLDLILGSHSEGASLGEVYRLSQNKLPTPICDICKQKCTFWEEELLGKIRKPYLQRSIYRKVLEKLQFTDSRQVVFYKSIFQHSKANFLVDSSKKASWIDKNYLALQKEKKIQPFLIYLSRDGRAVINSYYRKYPERGLVKISNNWINRINTIEKTTENWSKNQFIHIRYEDLAQQPTQTIERIMEWAKISFEPSMMAFWKHSHHQINGIAGTKSFLLKFKANDQQAILNETKKGYYQDHELGIRFDERWKKELQQEQIDLIERIINPTNLDIQYPKIKD